MLELNELLQLLLLELVADKLYVLAEVSDLRDLLLFGLCQLGVDVVNIFFDLFLGLEKRLAVLLLFSDIING